jgi:glucokinase
MAANRVIGVDVGGTKIRAGLVEPDGTIAELVEQPTDITSQTALLDQLGVAVRMLPLHGVQAVGFGLPTRVDAARGMAVGTAVNIPVRDVAFREEMQHRVGLPVEVENDASCAALAEFAFGAGRGARDMLILTLGTGVGGGVVTAGRLYRAWTELGHMVIVADGEPCMGACTGRGHLESYCSGQAVDVLARKVLGRSDASAHDLVRERHPALEGVGHLLGIAIGSLVNIFGSTRVVIGGGFGVAAFDQLVPAARPAVVREALSPSGQDLEIVPAELSEPGVIGAGLVALQGA